MKKQFSIKYAIFDLETDLNKHMAAVHEGNKLIKCQICNSFANFPTQSCVEKSQILHLILHSL